MASGQLSLYGAQQMLNAVFGANTAPIPATWYLALCTTIPTPAMNGSQISEPSTSGTSYARCIITNNSTYWSAQSNAPQVLNATNLYMPSNNATAAWPTCPGWALCDAPTAGNVWAVGTLAQPVTVPLGFQAVIAAGALSFELDPFYTVNVN